MKKKADIGVVIQLDFAFGSDGNDGLQLDCGKTLSPVSIRYETYGELNEEKTNAILIDHALSGNAHVAGYHSLQDKKPGGGMTWSVRERLLIQIVILLYAVIS